MYNPPWLHGASRVDICAAIACGAIAVSFVAISNKDDLCAGLARGVMTVHSAYLDACDWANRLKQKYIFGSLRNTPFVTATGILYAGNKITNITSIVVKYYTTNEVLSCASLQRWLRDNHVTMDKITIIRAEESAGKNTTLYISEIDLETEYETTADKELFMGDIALDGLPKCIMSWHPAADSENSHSEP